MSQRTWIYIIILIIVLGAGGVFFWWMYKTSKISPKAEVTPTPTFSDVPANYWAFTEIEAVNQAGYMIGYPDGTFKPADSATRATVAVAIARAVAGGDSAIPAAPSAPSYSDVPAEYWAYKHIEYLKTQNIMTGYEDGTFKPDASALRYTMAVVLARAKGLDLTPYEIALLPTPSFVDVPTTYHSYAEIEAVYKAGYTQGCRQDASGLYFCPDSDLLRDQLAVLTYNAYLKTTPSSPIITSPSQIVPSPSPKTPTASPTVTVTPTPTITPTVTPTPTPTTTTPTTTTGTTTTPAKTGAEVPLAGGGVLGLLFLVRYLVGKRIK